MGIFDLFTTKKRFRSIVRDHEVKSEHLKDAAYNLKILIKMRDKIEEISALQEGYFKNPQIKTTYYEKIKAALVELLGLKKNIKKTYFALTSSGDDFDKWMQIESKKIEQGLTNIEVYLSSMNTLFMKETIDKEIRIVEFQLKNIQKMN